MKTVTAKGRTVEEAIRNGLEELGATLSQVTTKVIDVPSTGLIGVFSTRYAKVELTLKDDASDAAMAFLDDVFSAMRLDVQVEPRMEDDILIFELKTPRPGFLIGKRGATLDALQYLTSLVFNKNQHKYSRIALDVESYREKRKRTLQDLADRTALSAERRRGKISLEPMNPYERRIIHASLQNYKNITTYSSGEEPNRYVIVEYKRDDAQA